MIAFLWTVRNNLRLPASKIWTIAETQHSVKTSNNQFLGPAVKEVIHTMYRMVNICVVTYNVCTLEIILNPLLKSSIEIAKI